MLVAQINTVMAQLPGAHLTWHPHLFGKHLRNLATGSFSGAKREVRKFWYSDLKRKKQKLSFSSLENQVLSFSDLVLRSPVMRF